MYWRVFRLGVVGIVAAALTVMMAGRAQAHPADEGRQEVMFSIRDGTLTWTHELWLGPLLGQPMWTQEVDTDGDGIASPAEQQTFVDTLRSMVELRIDGKLTPMTLQSYQISTYQKFVAQPAQPQITFSFSAPISAGDHTLAYRTMIDTHRIRFSAHFPSGGGVQVKDPNAGTQNFNAEVSIKPIALAQSDDTSASPAAANTTNTTEAKATASSLGADFALSPMISDLIQGSNFSPLLIVLGLLVSFGVGAVHALTPGHGKGIIAAYMVGEKGKLSHALTLAGTMTITHTSSVIVLGLIALLASRIIMPQILTPWLTLLSGVLILVVGGSLLWRRARNRENVSIEEREHALAYEGIGGSAHPHEHSDGHEHTHTHDDGHPHEHAHALDHEHAHGFAHTHDGHTHQHLTLDDVRDENDRITWRALVALGISGGLLPCADALAILLLSVSVNRIALGLVLLLAFSAGIALTLTMIGLVAAGGQRMLRRYDRLEPVLARLPVASAVIVLGLGAILSYQGVLAMSFIR